MWSRDPRPGRRSVGVRSCSGPWPGCPTSSPRPPPRARPSRGRSRPSSSGCPRRSCGCCGRAGCGCCAAASGRGSRGAGSSGDLYRRGLRRRERPAGRGVRVAKASPRAAAGAVRCVPPPLHLRAPAPDDRDHRRADRRRARSAVAVPAVQPAAAGGTMIDADVRVAVLGAPGWLARRGRPDGASAHIRDAVAARGGPDRGIGRHGRARPGRPGVPLGPPPPAPALGDRARLRPGRRRARRPDPAPPPAPPAARPGLPARGGRDGVCPARRSRCPADAAAVDPEHTYRAAVSHLRDDGADPGGRALAVVLRRLDAVAAAGVEVPREDAGSPAVRTWLASVGADNLTVAADRDFGAVRWFRSDSSAI